MRRKKLTWLIALAVLFAFSMLMVACKPGQDEPGPEPEPTLYTVTFDSNGGSAVPDQGVYEGEKVTKPGDPTRGGYSFVAWYKEEGLTTKWEFETDTVTGDMTLYAKWEFAPATSDEYFSYAPVEGGYMISAKLGETMPAALVIPSEKDGQDVVAIADNAFENQASVTSVLIPDTVTEIGRQAFRNCANLAAVNEGNNIASIAPNAFYGTAWDSNLTGGEVYLGKTLYKYAGGMYTDTEITVKDGTVGIAGNAFNGMEKLVKITLPEGVQNIGEYAFGGNPKGTGLTEISLPASLSEIGANAFRNSENLAKITIGKNVVYIGDNAFAGCSVTELDFAAQNAQFGAQGPFRGNTAAAEVTFDSGITTFPAKLFDSWTGLKNVSLGGVTDLPDNAFDGFENLETVSLENIETIGNYALRGTGIVQLTIPAGIVKIGNGAFANCKSLTTVNYNALDAEAPNSSNLAFAGCDKLTTINVGEEVAVPDYMFYNVASATAADIAKASKIGASAFAGTSLAVLDTGAVTEIAKNAFADTDLTKITIGAALENIGYNAFANNDSLTELVWNATSAETIYEQSSASLVRAIFNGCGKLATVTVGDNVESLPDYFLPDNTLITKIELPDGILAVGDSAFNGCTSLAQITNADDLKTIGQDAFTDTPWFTAYLEQDGLIYLGSILYVYNGDMPADTQITVREGTTAIANGAFNKQSNLTSVVLPNGLTSIGDRAFAGTSLTQVTIPASVTDIGSEAFNDAAKLASVTFNEGLKTIGDSAFDGCSLLNTVALPNSLTKLGKSAFLYAGRDAATADGTLTIGGGLTEIPERAFMGMSKTGGAVAIPSGIVSIGTYAFYYTGFSSVSIPDGVTTIGASAFASTKQLKAVTLPGSVSTLGNNVFQSSGIASATLNGTFTKIPESTFSGCDALTEITWQKTITEIGEKAFQSADALDEIDLTGIVHIGAYAFNPDSSNVSNGVSKVTFGEGLLTIGDFAFADAPITGELVLPSTLTTIGSQAFKGCKKITKVNIPGSVETFSSSAFRECSALQEVTISDGVKTIPGGAFMSCTKLTEITVPSSVTEIGGSAFTSAQRVYLQCAATAQVGKSVLGGGVFVVDKTQLEAFRENWSDYASSIVTEDMIVDDLFIVEDGTLIKFLDRTATSAEIPASVTAIANGVFTTTVKTLTVSEGNTAFKAEDSVLYSIDGKTLVYYLSGKADKSFTVPDSVEKIDATISNRYLNELTIGANVKEIAAGAFKSCSGLLTVTALGTTPATLGEQAIPTRVTTIYVPESAVDAYKSAWSAYAKIIVAEGTTIEFVVQSGNLIEYNGTNAEVVIPDGVTNIDAGVFSNRPEITKITLPASLKTIEGNNFAESTSLTHLVFNAENFTDVTFRVPTKDQQLFPYLTTLEIGANVTKIPGAMFAFTNLASVNIPATVTELSNYVFYNCESLTSVTLNEGLTDIGIGVFGNCPIGGTITIPSTLTSFGQNVFKSDVGEGFDLIYNAAGLESCSMQGAKVLSIQFGSNVTVIPASIAQDNTNITSIVIPDRITKIGTRAFNNCTELASIVLPAGLTEIGTSAFDGCAKLTGTLTIPANVTEIGGDAFAGTGYTKLVYNAKTATGSTSPNTPFPATIAEIEFGEGITRILEYFMNENTLIKSVAIPEGVTEIGIGAFRFASALESVTLPSTLESFGNYANNALTFARTKIKSIVIPDKVTVIPKNMFTDCLELTSITFGSGVTQVNMLASRPLSALQEIVFKSETPPTVADGFLTLTEGIQIKVPATAVETYKAAAGWSAYASCIVANTEE